MGLLSVGGEVAACADERFAALLLFAPHVANVRWINLAIVHDDRPANPSEIAER